MSLTVDIKTEGVIGIIALSGRIISDDQLNDILSKVEQAIASGTKSWICELTQLTYCNSIGLNLFIRILTKARNAGGDCSLVNLQPHVEQLFKLSKLSEIFSAFKTIEEARAHSQIEK